jgi:hypothetical protein
MIPLLDKLARRRCDGACHRRGCLRRTARVRCQTQDAPEIVMADPLIVEALTLTREDVVRVGK